MLNNRSEPLHFSCKYLRESLPVNGQEQGLRLSEEKSGESCIT